MKKILGIALAMSVFQSFATFFPTVTLVQTYAEEKTTTDINSLRKELEEEKESLVELNDELEVITEQEKESNERIDYIKTVIKDLESGSQQESEPGKNPQDELRSAKEELDAEVQGLEEIKDEMDAMKELKKETEDRIAELTAQIQKAESPKVARQQSEHPAEVSKQTPADTSKAASVSAGELKLTKKELQEQLKQTKEALEGEVESLDDAEDQLEGLRQETQEIEEQKFETEASISGLLVKVKELEAAIAAIEAQEKTQPSTK